MGNKFFKSTSNHHEPPRIIYPVTYRFQQLGEISDHPEFHARSKGNKVKTTKYTFYNFLYKNFWEQIHTFANVYFILIVILNFMPEVDAFAKEVAPVPVIIILVLSAIIDAAEDIKRYMLDKKINRNNAQVYSIEMSEYVETTWEDLNPGDFVKILANEMIPADILLLSSSDVSGICHIETANLDGENNLKQREIVNNPHYNGLNERFFPSKFFRKVEVEAPNSEIYHFTGVIHNAEPLTIKKQNLLLRGCVLRNTEFVEGMVIYAGHDTKAMLNNSGPRFKQSKLEARLNRDICYCVAILIIVCLIGSVGSFIWQQSFPTNNVLFIALKPNSYVSSPAFQAFINFWTFIIIFQSIVPLPLYVTLKFVKALQLWHLSNDIEMYDPLNEKRVEIHSFNIPEDLGQVEFVFCDKTGTLTENKMEFRMATINGQDYRFDENISDRKINQFNKTMKDDASGPNQENYKNIFIPLSGQESKNYFFNYFDKIWQNFPKTLSESSTKEKNFIRNVENLSRHLFYSIKECKTTESDYNITKTFLNSSLSPSFSGISITNVNVTANLTENAQLHQINMQSTNDTFSNSKLLTDLRPLVSSISFCDCRDNAVFNSFASTIKGGLLSDKVYMNPNNKTPCVMSSASSTFTSDELRVQDFFIALAVCNTTVVSINKNNPIPLKMPTTEIKKPKKSTLLKKNSEERSSFNFLNKMKNIFSSGSINNTKIEISPSIHFDAKETDLPIKNFAIRTQAKGTRVLTNLQPLEETSDKESIGSSSYSIRPKFDVSSEGSNNVNNSNDNEDEFDEKSLTDQSGSLRRQESNNSQLESLAQNVNNTFSSSSLNDVAIPRCPLEDKVLIKSYESESPDELCLVKMACILGCKLLQRGPNFVQIWLPELGLVTLEVLHILAFDSTRKRMSVIIRHPISSEIILYTKGADSAVFPCLSQDSHALERCNSKHYVQSANTHLNMFSREGLRTLVIAKRIIPDAEYQLWREAYSQAEASFGNNEDLLSQLTNRIESNLYLLGATGIEDKLQEEVPETIQALRDAGINVWVLTGDKQETAVNIAYSSKLVSEDQTLIKLNAKDSFETGKYLDQCLREVKRFVQSGLMELPANLLIRGNGAGDIHRQKRKSLSMISKKKPTSQISLHSSDMEATIIEKRVFPVDNSVVDTGVISDSDDSLSRIDLDIPHGKNNIISNIQIKRSRKERRRTTNTQLSFKSNMNQISGSINSGYHDPRISSTLPSASGSQPPIIVRRHMSFEGGIRNNFSGQSRKKTNILDRRKHFALVLDGETLGFALKKENLSAFMKLCCYCVSVVCCRATPLQKAKVVKLVKHHLNVQTLAIGDGANDVNMIKVADIGIGISGQEGMQASMASDYAISRFKFLRRLLFVHGHWCYDKLARTSLYIIYKDAIYIFVMFWFQLFNGFSGSSTFDQLSQVLFAVTMTSIPAVVMGIWDNPVDAKTLMNNACLYQDGQQSRSYKPLHFWANILDSIWQSLIIFFMTYLIYLNSDVGIWEFGYIQVNCLIVVTLFHAAIEFRYWTILHVFSLVGSYVIFWLLFLFIYHAVAVTGIQPESPYWIIYTIMSKPFFYLTMLLIIPASLLPRFGIYALANSLNPTLDVVAGIFIQNTKYQRGEKMCFEKYLRCNKRRYFLKDKNQTNLTEIDKNRNTLDCRSMSQPELRDLSSDRSPLRIMPNVQLLLRAGSKLIRAVPNINKLENLSNINASMNEEGFKRPQTTPIRRRTRSKGSSTINTLRDSLTEESGQGKPPFVLVIASKDSTDKNFRTSNLSSRSTHRRVQSYSDAYSNPTTERSGRTGSNGHRINQSLHPIPYNVLFPDSSTKL